MCVRGVWQLKKLHLQFCDHGGSSKGVREFLESDLLKEFVKKNPQIEFKFLLKRGTHPFITSTYVNGYIKDLSLRNKNPEEIIEEFKRVRNSIGRKALPHAGTKVYGSNKSIQGIWKPNMWGTYPKHQLEKYKEIPPFEQEFEFVKRDPNADIKRRQDDFYSRLWKRKTLNTM